MARLAASTTTGYERLNIRGGGITKPPCMSLDDCDRKGYGESGTRGRMGLGADPAHPEGPGNVSD